MKASSKQQAASSAVASRPHRRGGLYIPKPIAVSGANGSPQLVGGVRVESIRDEWLVEDRWWSSEPLRRRYLELVLSSGRCTVVFCDLEAGRWYEQR